MRTILNGLAPLTASQLNTFVKNPPILICKLEQSLQGELEHRRVKRFYKRTNKGVSFPHQIAKQERMQRHYRKYVETIMKKTGTKGRSVSQPGTSNDEDRSPRRHHSISERSRGYLGLYEWVYGKDMDDPALKVSVPVSKRYLANLLIRTSFQS